MDFPEYSVLAVQPAGAALKRPPARVRPLLSIPVTVSRIRGGRCLAGIIRRFGRLRYEDICEAWDEGRAVVNRLCRRRLTGRRGACTVDGVAERAKRWPWHGWIGLVLMAVFWALNWGLEGMRTHWGFFPMWLGYALTVDGLVLRRTGSSLLTRSPRGYAGLFAASIPAWWLFELINLRTQNWFYVGTPVGKLEYALLASLNFSTVIPAVFGTAELAGSFGWIRRLRRGPRIAPTRGILWGFFLGGWLMLALLLRWPRYFFPLVWVSVYFILEPVNVWRGNRSLAEFTREGDWRPVVALWTGSLVCGFFWEFWNYWSYPKWVYEVPFVDVLRVFEMPLLGYGGYLPFALELHAVYHLMQGAFGRRRWTYVRLGRFGQR